MDQETGPAGIDHDPGRQFQQALTADKEELFQIMQSQEGELLLTALRNPALDENHLLALLKRRCLPEELFTTLYCSKRLLEHHRVISVLACHPETPAHIAQTLLPRLYILDLARICLVPGVTADLRMLAERCIVQRLPTQPLGTKLTLARRGTAPVVDACLSNPHLKEGAVHQFIASYQSTAETISMVARSARWKGRPNIRLVILKNPRTPAIWFTLFLPGLSSRVLRELLSVQRLTMAQKELVRQAFNHG
ncbi:hypothetical protein [Pelobacter propionicus]|uniref:Leucine rich repeat variant n=1 Tax=Pelobacter propionicus (strain DSM 2379 / NBRC 103807 / OttBd1) TaxID=338966 RepID=A1AK48_PELPD|nr:hypothetical protein [Pelobacter propionicus]ABK97718.1 conserved hypothetical protein [Pelobacter propionicus DSM 2379]